MKIIFLSVLASTVLSVLSYKPSCNSLNAKKTILTAEDANEGFLKEDKKTKTNPDFIHTGIARFYVTPDKLSFFTGHGHTWYELRGSVNISGVDPRDWNTVHFDHYNDYSTGNFYRDDVWFNERTGIFDFFICTDNENAQGYIDFVYTYEHDPNLVTWHEPVDNNGIVSKQWVDYEPSYGEYVSSDIRDFEPRGAQSIAETFKLTGNLQEVNIWDYLSNWCWPPEKDSDWYKFEVKQTIKYSCTFIAPNSYYTLKLLKSRFESVYDYSMVTKYSCNGSKNFNITLNAGTYYVQITMSDKTKIVPNATYQVIFDCSQTNNYFPLYYNNFKNFKAVVWESEFIPDNFPNRWSSNRHELRWYKNDGSARAGYYDPVFDGAYLSPTQTLLDSVIYIWGQDQLTFLLKTLGALETLIHLHYREMQRMKQITSDIVAIAGGAYNLVATGVDIAGGSGSVLSTAISGVDPLTGANDLISMGIAICDLILGTVPDEIDYYMVQENALGKLIGSIDGLLTDPNGVIAIPVYGNISFGERNDYALGQRMSWTYNRSFVPYQKKYMSSYNSLPTLTNVFKFDRIEEVQTLFKTQSDEIVDTRMFHGSIHSFKSIRQLKKHINYDYIMEGNI